VLAEDSESADVMAELVDVGEGTKEAITREECEREDCSGERAAGRCRICSGEIWRGGIVSYAQNQKTAWWEKMRT